MKNLNLLLLTISMSIIFFTPKKIFSQENEILYKEINLYNFSVNDSIIINRPLNEEFSFIYKKNDIKKEVKKQSKFIRKLGKVLNSVGATTKNIGILKSGIRVIQASNLIGNAIDASIIFDKNIENIKTKLDDIYVIKDKNQNSLIGEFQVKNITYLIDLNSAISINEITKK